MKLWSVLSQPVDSIWTTLTAPFVKHADVSSLSKFFLAVTLACALTKCNGWLFHPSIKPSSRLAMSLCCLLLCSLLWTDVFWFVFRNALVSIFAAVPRRQSRRLQTNDVEVYLLSTVLVRPPFATDVNTRVCTCTGTWSSKSTITNKLKKCGRYTLNRHLARFS